LHAGGLGDLVLVESYLAALRERYPGARLELICRADVAPVASLYAEPPDSVIPFDFDPYRWALPDDRTALQAKTLLRKLSDEAVDLFVAAELRSTWLSEILAAALAPRDALIADERLPRPSDLLLLLGKLKLTRNADVRRIGSLAFEHELDRYARLAGANARRLPALRGRGTPAAELVVFALASSRINRWPLSAMGAAALRVAATRRAAIVLVGSEKDRPELEAAIAAGTFGPEPQLVAGAPGDLPAVAARIAGAAGYLGIETGLVHLAAAFGVPGAAVYGGGYWPVYGPWSARSAAVVAPIPCFGCEWDCAFDRPFCMESIDVDSVVSAFEDAYQDGSGRPLVRALEPYGERERTVFGAAAAVHHAAQRDRAARLTEITRLRDLLGRYGRRTRARNRKVNAALAAVTETMMRTAGRLDEARTAQIGSGTPARRSDEQ
jgi:ADP-heptose:LPS heptosyltransferase